MGVGNKSSKKIFHPNPTLHPTKYYVFMVDMPLPSLLLCWFLAFFHESF